jgi:hypothetical protein
MCTTHADVVNYGDWLHRPAAPTVLLYGHQT